MSPGDLDARLRQAMAGQPDPVADLDAPAALGRVLQRSGRRTRARHGLTVAAAAAVAGLVAGALLVALPSRDSAPEPAPAPRPGGTYERAVGSGAWRGDWSISLDEGHTLGLVAPQRVPPDEAPTDGASYRLTGQVLTLDAFTNGVCTERVPGSYTYSVLADGRLLLEALEETCAPRERLFSGLWEPVP